MSKINIELFGYDAELVSFDGEEGGTLSFEFPTLYDGYIYIANQTVRITGRECTVSTVNIENGEYIPHLILTDRTIDLPKIRVLHGVISPLDNIGPAELCIKELVQRLGNDEVKEVILATSPTVEGDTTALYIAKLIKPLGVAVTRLAYGLPVGSDLEYADELTLSKAIENRREV